MPRLARDVEAILKLATLGVTLAILAAATYVVATGEWRRLMPMTDQQRIEVVRSWARVEPLPASAAGVVVRVTGSDFTRGYRVRFHAAADEIEGWIAASAGTAGVAPKRVGPVWTYVVEPGGGAAYAEVIVDEAAGTVEIHAYWS